MKAHTQCSEWSVVQRCSLGVVLATAAWVGLLPATAAAQRASDPGVNRAATVFVDRAWSAAMPGAEVSAGRFAGLNAFATIQSAVDAAPPGGTVNVAPGSYVEQVVIDGKDLTLAGAGAGNTFIVSPAVLATSFVAGIFTNKPVILCRNAADIRVRDLTVDGDGQGIANERFIGIAFFNAGGGIFDASIVRVRNAPLDNAQHGFAVYSQTSGGGPYALECSNVEVSDFQKNGFLLSGAGVTVDVHDCTVTGSGDLTVIAQNGIQLGSGAGGAIRDCALSNLRYIPGIAVSAGLLVFQPGSPVSLSGLTGAHAFSNVQAPIGWYDGNGSIDGVEVTGPIIAGQDFAMILISNFTASSPQTPAMVARDGRLMPPAVPVQEPRLGPEAALGASQMMSSFTVDVSHLCLNGTDVVGTTGLYAFSSGGPLEVNITQSLIHDWDFGLQAVGAATLLSMSNSSIVSNMSAGFDNSGSASASVTESNWWGATSGPSGAGPGSGDAIIGPGVDFNPWLVSGTNSEPGCGFSAAPEQIDVVATGGCISTATPCVTVDVTIDRSTMTDVRGFSIPVQLSSNLELCSGVSSITEGAYLNAVGASNFQVIDHGGGAYTIDGVLLGLPCGATAISGTLFSLSVAKAPGPDGTGTVTLGPPTLRDCDNGPVVATTGTPASITTDATGPLALGDVTAAQVKSGNDTDGTTKVLLTFTLPGDAVSVEVYRAGFSNYPEYDDAPGSGSAPAAPAYPPVAPWTLTGITASGQSDEVVQRDFWYYVVFSKDACGNVSLVSNRTNGILNYHLGDVSNGFVAGQGNNQVLAEDISLLGIHYLALLGAGDPFSYLDVGPTVSGSVNSLPVTDNRVDFEDLIIFALNYSLVSAPLAATPVDLPDRNVLSLDVPALPRSGETFEVALHLSGSGDVHGMSLGLAWDAAVVEPIDITAGELLKRQSRGSTVLPAGPGALDLALLGPGAGITGTGELARVTFRVLASGDPGIKLDRMVARDAANDPVSFEPGAAVQPSPVAAARTSLGAVAPNPSRGGVNVEFSLARAGHAALSVFDLSGRRVRTLLNERRQPGVHREGWNGRDEAGVRVPAGFYVLRLDTDGTVTTRRVLIVR